MQEVISYDFVIEKFHTNICPILDGYGVMTVWILEKKLTIIDNKRNKTINQHNAWYI